MRVSYMKPGRRAREERLVSREFPDYKTDDRGEPSDAGAEEIRTYVSHRFVVAAVSILQRCGWRSQRREAICRGTLRQNRFSKQKENETIAPPRPRGLSDGLRRRLRKVIAPLRESALASR